MKQGLLPVLVIDFTNQTDLVEHDNNSNNNVLLVFLIGTRVLDALRPCYLLFWLVRAGSCKKIKGVVKKSQEICFVQYTYCFRQWLQGESICLL